MVLCLNTSVGPVLVKAGMIVTQFQPFQQLQASDLSIGSATSKFSIVNSSSLHTTCTVQHEDSRLQQKTYSDYNMPTYFEQLFEGATQVCDDNSQKARI